MNDDRLVLPDNASEIIEANVDRISRRCADWARHMAARFNGPIYLIGSTLHNPSPRDTDLRIVVDDHEFARRYDVPMVRREFPETHHYRKRTSIVAGDVVPWGGDDYESTSQRWVDDCAKLGAYLAVSLCLNVDLKVVPASWWREDVWPRSVLLASPSPKWFVYSRFCPDPSSSVVDDGEGAE
jgi:hypothetical protein